MVTIKLNLGCCTCSKYTQKHTLLLEQHLHLWNQYTLLSFTLSPYLFRRWQRSHLQWEGASSCRRSAFSHALRPTRLRNFSSWWLPQDNSGLWEDLTNKRWTSYWCATSPTCFLVWMETRIKLLCGAVVFVFKRIHICVGCFQKSNMHKKNWDWLFLTSIVSFMLLFLLFCL